MPFVKDVVDGIGRLAETRYNSMSDMANKIKASQPVLSKLLNGKAHPRADVLGRILDALGARIVFPDEVRDKKRECVFVGGQGGVDTSGRRVEASDYRALPFYAAETFSAPDEGVDSANWIVLNVRESGLALRENVVCVRLSKDDHSMEPAFFGGDMVVVDMDERNPSSGGRAPYLVKHPDGRVSLRRVSLEDRKGQTWLAFHADAPGEFASLYSLQEDYGGQLSRAVLGRAVWQCGDASRR